MPDTLRPFLFRTINALDFILSGVICGIYCFSCFSAYAADGDKVVYKDKNGYFTITVPSDWSVEDFSTKTRSKVQFKSKDGVATIGLIATLDNDNLGDLFLMKRQFIDEHEKSYSQGKFMLSKTEIAGLESLKVDYEIPGVLKEELYYFFADGVRYDVVYGTRETSYYNTYKDIAFEAISSLNPQRRVPKRKQKSAN